VIPKVRNAFAASQYLEVLGHLVFVDELPTRSPIASAPDSRPASTAAMTGASRPQIEYGLLTDPDGRPVATRVFAGNTADPTAFSDAVSVVREEFKLNQMVLVGDRGMITTARIDAIRQTNTDTGSGLGWLTALRAPAIKKLAAEGGPWQPTLFDEQNLAEITCADYHPG
jgi:hypothetical protein